MYDKPDSQTVVLFADPPALHELCLISVSVKNILQTVSSTSRFQIQTIKCREIIFTEPDVIASPAFECESIFHIVLQQSLYKSGRLHARFQKLGLEISKPTPVSPTEYQSCLRYTLLAKLAPNWNKAGQWLIQGRDFLNQAGYSNAVKMDVTVTKGELFFTIDASTVRFPSLKLEDLDVPAPCYHNFLQNPNAIIHQHSIFMAWCHVLPSMKKGKIVSISHELPDDGVFKSYKEIKRHWKNHYGYRLPEDEDGMLYYQINFKPLGEKLFTYPEICLRARDIQKVPRIDPKPVLVAVLQDLQKKMPRICGFPLKLHNKACYPSIDLYSVTQVEKQTAQNLTLKPPNKKIIFRNTDDIQKLVTRNINNLTNNCHQSSDFVVAQKTILKDAKIYTTDANINEEHHVNATLERNCTYGSNIEGSNLVTNSNQADLSVDDRHSMHLNSMPLLKFNEGQIQQDSIVDKIIPVFKSKDRRSDKLLQILPKSNAKAHPVVPVFKTKTLKASIVYPNEKTDMETSQLLRGQDTCQSKGTLQTTTGFPDFNTSRNPNILKKPNFKSSVQRPEILKHYTQQNNVLASPRVNSNKSSVKAQSVQRDLNAALNSVPNIDRKTMKIPVPPLQSTHLSKPYTTPVSTPLSHKGVLSQSPFQNVKNTPVIIPSTPKGNGYSLTAMSPVSTTQCFQKQVENISGLSSTPSTPGIKRPCPSSHEGTPVMKKPRPKQQVQDVNVEFLARSNQLNKVNTVTLVSWLKDMGVVCKSKDKKGDLVEKTLKLLNLTVSEQ